MDAWISRYGVPSDLVSDQGRQFVSSLWRHLMTTLGISSSTTTAYHPQANGMVECFHRTLKERLMARQAGPTWVDHLSPVLMGHRASIREDSLTSPADLIFGAPLQLPGAVFEPDPPTGTGHDVDEFVGSLHQRLASVVPHPVNFHTKMSGSLPRSLQSARAVFLRVDAVRRPLEPLYEGPFEVLQRGLKTFTIRHGLKDVVVSVDRLKPAFPVGEAMTPTSPSSPSQLPPTLQVPQQTPRVPPPVTKVLPQDDSPSPLPVRTRSGRVSCPAVRFADIS